MQHVNQQKTTHSIFLTLSTDDFSCFVLFGLCVEASSDFISSYSLSSGVDDFRAPSGNHCRNRTLSLN